MAEPWLDSLSEDWRSDPPSSISSSRPSTSRTSRPASSSFSHSRIPHLAHNIRNTSGNGSFLKPRSSRGIARQNENKTLSERTPSSLNVVPQSPANASKSRIPSAMPRRASRVLSDSQNSVQHHPLNKDSQLQETPEWKRKLQEGENADSDGFDLFSPSKLEGMFRQSSCPLEAENDENDEDDDDAAVETENKPWNILQSTAFPTPDTYSSHRTSKSRLPGLGTLQEVDDEDAQSVDLSALSLHLTRETETRGIVKQRASNLEPACAASCQQMNAGRSRDPRMRTISGRKEIQDESFSSLEDSERSSIRKQALQETLDSDPRGTTRRIRGLRSQGATRSRSRSRSSDHEVSYDAEGLNMNNESILPEDPVAEITSQSLPEDLSMGTQNNAGESILLSNRRRPRNLEDSIIRRTTSVSAPDTSQLAVQKQFRSSPPPYKNDTVEESNASIGGATSPVDTSVVHHAPTPAQHSTVGSPLKLFGTRDTYTNNKLIRVLTQYEDEQAERQPPDEAAALRMSNFGKGELDDFGFDKEVERPAVAERKFDEAANTVFKDLASLTIDEKKVTPEQASPAKERSPKRRRTLLQDEMFVHGVEVEVRVNQALHNSLAGKKRRDALPGKDAEPASPETLASRSILRPSGSRKSSAEHNRANSASETLQLSTKPLPAPGESPAAELQSFTQSMAEVKQDSRKASLATKDYMEEANKVMEFIRARGKPKAPMPEIAEPEDVSDLNPDAILDLEVDDSTKDSFSRPPSREGRVLPRVDRRHARHDAATADHLKKFHEPDDLELLTSTSALGPWPLTDNEAVKEAALVPVPHEEPSTPDLEASMQSDPPGIRILNENDRKRKHSATETDHHGSRHSNSDGSRQTIVTTSSSGSGRRGVISQGTVSIPDTIGTMTFDHEKQIWVKQKLQAAKPLMPNLSPGSKTGRQEVSEADPFDGIADLSIDEVKEASWKKSPLQKERRTHVGHIPQAMQDEAEETKNFEEHRLPVPAKSSLKSPRRQRPSDEDRLRESDVSRHEKRLHNGQPSRVVDGHKNQQPRVVTIAFSSPIASEIPYVQPPSISDADLEEDDPSLLPLDEDGSVLGNCPLKGAEPVILLEETQEDLRPRTIMGSLERHEQYRAMTLNRRPVSRIDEYDEEQDRMAEANNELSLVHLKHTEVTPMPERQVTLTKTSTRKESSILCLTPLSEFTLHQADKENHPEESYVADRANPKTLRQAHGSAALVEDALVKAITDAEPSELYWEQLRRLSLMKCGLSALHGLQDYCMALEHLDVSGNKIAQLNGLPSSIRSLDISSNCINDLTSWQHLYNLQSINVSGNRLESLECFSGLIHLRYLNASDNRIRSVGGVLQLSGLVTLDVSGNDIPEIDFYRCEMMMLEDLDLCKNNLMHVKNLHLLPKLKSIDLTENLLEDLTVNKDKVVPALETLCLGQNDLSMLDLTAFPALQRLNIDDNAITSLPGLSEMHQLAILSARGQRAASELVNMILTTQHDCRELYLSSNVIPEAGLAVPTIPNYTLRCLEIASCGVQELPPGFGDRFPNTRVLNLNFNAVADLTPLQGMIKLTHLFLAKNRIRKMRRTCLTLSRLPALKKVDVRDNPLTVGFYAPIGDVVHSSKPYCLPERKSEQDHQWVRLMDEVTWLRRRAMELLMTDCVQAIEELDGSKFDRMALLKEQAIWQRLMGKGVLQKAKDVAEVAGEAMEVYLPNGNER